MQMASGVQWIGTCLMLSDTLKLLLPEMCAAQQTAAAQACYVKDMLQSQAL